MLLARLWHGLYSIIKTTRSSRLVLPKRCAATAVRHTAATRRSLALQPARTAATQAGGQTDTLTTPDAVVPAFSLVTNLPPLQRLEQQDAPGSLELGSVHPSDSAIHRSKPNSISQEKPLSLTQAESLCDAHPLLPVHLAYRKRWRPSMPIDREEYPADAVAFTSCAHGIIDLERAAGEAQPLKKLRESRKEFPIRLKDLQTYLTGMSAASVTTSFTLIPNEETNDAPLIARDEDDNGMEMVRFEYPDFRELPSHNFKPEDAVCVRRCTLHKTPRMREEKYVPEAVDPNSSLAKLEEDGVIARGKIKEIDLHSIVVEVKNRQLMQQDRALYHIEAGFDDWLLVKQEMAVATLAFRVDAETHRLDNERRHRCGSTSGQCEIRGTELRMPLLRSISSSPQENPTQHCEDGGGAARAVTMFHDNAQVQETIQRLEACNDPVMVIGDLNRAQRASIVMALKGNLSLIQGVRAYQHALGVSVDLTPDAALQPPGTGKTNTIVALLCLLKLECRIEEPVFVTAYTHNAIESLARRAIRAGLKVTIFGAVGDSSGLDEHALSAQMKRHALWPAHQAFDAKVNELLARRLALRRELNRAHLKHAKFARGERARLKNSLPLEIEKLKTEIGKVRFKRSHVTKTMEFETIRGSDVTFSTCLGADAYCMSTVDFPIVIMDEATQCNLLQSLIPLMKGCRYAVLVGDHKQLAPLSCRTVKEAKLDVSLYEHLHMVRDVPRSLLSTQYRMLSAIADTWNHLFYNGAVETSAERIAAGQGLHESDAVTFLDHRHFEKESQDSHSRGSKYNEGEASILMKILGTCIEEKGRTGKSQADTLKDIGIVSPYKSQVRFLQDAADKAFGVDHGLEIGTVETFQGREKDTMILSLVRSNGHIYSIGAALSFVTEPRRICVLLSRAKNRLFIVGNSDTLSRFANKWSEVISHCKLKGCFVQAKDWLDGKLASITGRRGNSDILEKRGKQSI